MKKLFLSLFLFSAILFAPLAQNWETAPIKDRWGDVSGTSYMQAQTGNDEKYSYGVAFAFYVDTDHAVFCVYSKVVDSLTFHPGHSFIKETISVSFRQKDAIEKFSGYTEPTGGEYNETTIFVKDVWKLYTMLKKNETYDVLIEGKNWYIKTKVVGGLSINLNAEEVLQFSEDKKMVMVKNGYRPFVEKITIPDGVEDIEELAFAFCTALKQITIPKSVTEIGKGAFGGCESLESITIPNSVTEIGESAFDGCKSLKSITIPNSVTEIGKWAFNSCESLESITIPNSVTEIGDGAFHGCKLLESINIPNSVTEIGDDAFHGCKSLESITIPNSVTEIGESAFEGCKSLKNITIPNSVTEIGMWAFHSCKSLKSITIPNPVTEIGAGTFCYCTSLESISIPSSVTSFGDNIFSNCFQLKEINSSTCVLQDGLVIIHNTIDSVVDEKMTNCVIPEGVTMIEMTCFLGMNLLETITIPKSVSTIGSFAFSSCRKLKTIIIEEGSKLESLDFGDVFFNCENVKTITLPKSVKLSRVPTSVQIIRN